MLNNKNSPSARVVAEGEFFMCSPLGYASIKRFLYSINEIAVTTIAHTSIIISGMTTPTSAVFVSINCSCELGKYSSSFASANLSSNAAPNGPIVKIIITGKIASDASNTVFEYKPQIVPSAVYKTIDNTILITNGTISVGV